MGMFLVSKAFGRESELWKKQNKVMMLKEKKNQRIIKVTVIYPLGSINVWSKFHCNISSRCWNLSQNRKCEHNSAIKWSSMKSLGFIAGELNMSAPNFAAIH